MNSKKFLPLAVLVVISIAPSVAGDLNSEGIKAFRAKDYQLAEKLYRQVLAQETDSAALEAAYNNLAVLYQAQGKDASEFTAKAAELAKSHTTKVLTNDSSFSQRALPGSLGGFVQQPANGVAAGGAGLTAQPPTDGAQNPSTGAQRPAIGAQSPANGAQNPSIGAQGPASAAQNQAVGSPPIWVNSGMQNMRTESSFGVNTPFGGFQRNSVNNYGMPGYGYPGNLGSGYSVQGPNGSFDYSDASPVILNAPNGQPVIIRAPGPNTSATQQNPDGSTTTIINRTY